MKFEQLLKCIHPDWNALKKMEQGADPKHYFVSICRERVSMEICEIEDEFSITFPESLTLFYKEVGMGFFWANCKNKKGTYRVLSPAELLELYFDPEENEEDIFITYRRCAWEQIDDQLLAFCLFGEEDSLLYISLTDGAIYYLSSERKISNSLDEFIEMLDSQVDYFMH